MRVPQPNFTVSYNNKNITSDISPFLLSISYTDKTEGESDEIEIELHDADDRWKNSWYPEKGATLDVTMGRIKCGVFEIDEIEIKGPPDTVTIRGMATGIKNSLRSRNSAAHENKTLRQIALKVAQKNNLSVSGTIPDITIGRVTQNKETDLAFLKRISQDYGIIFSVRGSVITFTSIYDLQERGSSFSIDKTDLMDYSLKDKADGMVKASKVSTKNPKKNESISVNLEYEEYKKKNPSFTSPPVVSGDTNTSYKRCENKQQAEAKAKAIMHLSATNQQKGNISIHFNDLAVAGNNFFLTGLGKLAGKYHIVSSSHRMDRSGGGVSELEIKRMQEPTKAQQKPKPKIKKQQPKNARVINAKNVSIGRFTNNRFD